MKWESSAFSWIAFWFAIQVAPAQVLDSEAKTRLEQVQERSQSVMKEMASLDKQLFTLRQDQRRLNEQILDKELLVTRIEKKIDELRKSSSVTEATLADTVRNRWILDLQKPVDTFFLWPFHAELELEQEIYSKISMQQQQKIAAITAKVHTFKTEIDRFDEEKEALLKLQAIQKQKSENILTLQARYQNIQDLLKTQKDYYAKLALEKDAAARSMDQLMTEATHSSQSDSDSRVEQLKGQLLFPVEGNVEKKYGSYMDQRLQTKVYHKGIDIRATYLSPVRAVFDGKVVFAHWFDGYGQTLIVDHGSGDFSLYAHLEKFMKKVGDPVIVGDIIGLLGQTESLKGAYLYFEFRRKGISEDPLDWLGNK